MILTAIFIAIGIAAFVAATAGLIFSTEDVSVERQQVR